MFRALDTLEPRTMLFAWTANEVYLAELVNRARANPYGEEVIYPGLDLEADLTAAEIANIGPKEPLALFPAITESAREHNLDMAERNFFAHDNPDGEDPDARATRHGYDGSAGENIAAGYDTVNRAHQEWLISVGHRKNVLSLWTGFPSYDELGTATFQPGSGAGYTYRSYYTQVFGLAPGSRTWVLGVVIDDADGDSFYTPGEGQANIRVDVALSSAPDTIVGTYTTDAAGNYQIEVEESGTYVVTFTNQSTGQRVVKQTTVEIGTNMKVDAEVDELTTSVAPPDNTKAAEDALVSGAADSSGRLTVAAVNTDDQPIAFTQNGFGGWTGVDIRDQAGGPDLIGPPEVFVNPLDGLTYAAAASTEGLALYRRSTEGVWTVRNLSTETGADAVEGQVTVFVSQFGVPYVAGLNATGELLLFVQGAQRSDGQFNYSSRNLSESAFTPAGLETPTIQGPLISYVTSWNAFHVNGLNSAGQIVSFWFHSSLSDWTISNLSNITGAPAISGTLTAYLTSWGGINLAGANADGELTVTWWVPAFGGDWRINNLSEQFSGPSLGEQSLTAYVTPWGGLNVAGLTESGALTIYWWSPGLEDWRVSSISSLLPDAEPVTTTLRGASARATGATSVLGTSADGDVMRYSWEPGGDWMAENLSELV